ncbi:polymeric immunoglobulin receptor-like [Colossoma macropomum]|uniref:polymeric immunoglobulin receptor-like n=1 Tax=Colossoma macropomum TaxID=42526 RepID=UPI0018649D69|nr:polymeric immunoglobulin receptor-like [Colossoma macropomum]
MWLCVFLLYSVLQESSGCTVERGVGATITKSVGDSVVLLCSCTKQTKVNPQTVQWGYSKKFVGGDYTAEHSVFLKNGSQNQRYRDRVQRLNQNKPGDLSLIISHLTEEDEGTYLCGVKGKYNRSIILYVRGCAVLEQGERMFSRSPGESVLLPCPCPTDQHKINPDRAALCQRLNRLFQSVDPQESLFFCPAPALTCRTDLREFSGEHQTMKISFSTTVAEFRR